MSSASQSGGAAAPTRYPHLFEPVTIGTMKLRNRVMAPPHSSAIGNLWGSEADAERNMAYWDLRARSGLAWIDGVTGRIGNHFIPGFEPSGISAETLGFFRLPFYVERIGEFVRRMGRHGALVTCQMTMIGGFPHAPSARLANATDNAAPHVLTTDEIARFVAEYRYSAERAAAAGLAGIELHFNHDDLIEAFLSPLTNRRDDAYGGSFENRARFATEILAAIRDVVGRSMTVGVRLNLREEMPGGYDAAGGRQIAQHLVDTGHVDFIHAVVGAPWGKVSYIQPHHYQAAAWSALAGDLRKEVGVPVVYSGRVNSPDAAEKVLAAGHADVVGIARAHIADGELLAKAAQGRAEDIRPCIGGNDCINRRYVEGLPFGCAVNPLAGKEVDGPLPRAERPRRLLIAGGGPAGMELAALAAESGHEVQIWEAGDRLGGLLRLSTRAPDYDKFADYLAWQERRLARLKVGVTTERTATVEDLASSGADTLAIATGSAAYRPALPGIEADHVLESRDILAGRAMPGERVVVIVEDDHMAPLALADLLSRQGREVTLVYATHSAAQLLGRYILGAPLARLDAAGVSIRVLEQAVEILPDGVRVRHVHSGRERDLTGYDSVVLSCGGVSQSALFDGLRGRHDDVHILGDAYAPRRIVFATRQAHALARLLAVPT